MRKIPESLLRSLTSDPWYGSCCLKDDGSCDGRIEFHHNLIYAGRQVNEKFCILPACQFHHKNVHRYGELFDWIMLNRATDGELQSVSKAIDYRRRRERLNKKYGLPKAVKKP